MRELMDANVDTDARTRLEDAKFNNPQQNAILEPAKDVAIEVMKVVDQDTGAATRAMIAAIEATHREELEKHDQQQMFAKDFKKEVDSWRKFLAKDTRQWLKEKIKSILSSRTTAASHWYKKLEAIRDEMAVSVSQGKKDQETMICPSFFGQIMFIPSIKFLFLCCAAFSNQISCQHLTCYHDWQRAC